MDPPHRGLEVLGWVSRPGQLRSGRWGRCSWSRWAFDDAAASPGRAALPKANPGQAPGLMGHGAFMSFPLRSWTSCSWGGLNSQLSWYPNLPSTSQHFCCKTRPPCDKQPRKRSGLCCSQSWGENVEPQRAKRWVKTHHDPSEHPRDMSRIGLAGMLINLFLVIFGTSICKICILTKGQWTVKVCGSEKTWHLKTPCGREKRKRNVRTKRMQTKCKQQVPGKCNEGVPAGRGKGSVEPRMSNACCCLVMHSGTPECAPMLDIRFFEDHCLTAVFFHNMMCLNSMTFHTASQVGPQTHHIRINRKIPGANRCPHF